jgi:hypothetical protein
MPSKRRKFLIILASLFLIFICFSFVYALEIEYPAVKGQQPPTKETTFPEYVKYIFNFSIIITGVVAFGVLVSSGAKILFSPDDTETIKDAKNKMIGAFVGIVFLLGSYLILTTINPSLSGLSLEPLKPVTGIYLFNSKGEKDYIPQSTPRITFDANRLEFLSTKDELSSIYIYSGENYKGSEAKIDNPKTSQNEVAGASVGSLKSIYFLWNKPGVYLYPKTNFEGRPFYSLSSVSGLPSEFNKKVNSAKFNEPKGVAYGAAFFTQSDYRGQCGFIVSTSETPNLSSGGNNYYHPVGNIDGGISSFALFNYGSNNQGSVTFYDSVNCTGNSKKVDIKGSVEYNQVLGEGRAKFDNSDIPLGNHIMSFEINGNLGVVLTTENKFEGRCQLFFKPSGTTCFPSIVDSYLYDISTWIYGPKVGTYAVIPLAE